MREARHALVEKSLEDKAQRINEVVATAVIRYLFKLHMGTLNIFVAVSLLHNIYLSSIFN
jgi:hypothetical protein